MQQRKSHPDSFKKDAVRRLIARGSKTVTEIAKELGVSPSIAPNGETRGHRRP
jgi:transposase-like protein